MFLISKIEPSGSRHFWFNLIRISISLSIILMLVLTLLTTRIQLQPGVIAVSILFLAWGILAHFSYKLWKHPAQVDRITAFVDLAFSVIMVIVCREWSLDWLPSVFLLPTLEFSSFYGMAGAGFVVVTFAWTTILAGLMNVTLIQQPLWWLRDLLWGAFIFFTATLQELQLLYMRYIPSWARARKKRLPKADEQRKTLSEEDAHHQMKERLSLMIPQVAAAFELPFQRMGVRTEEYHQEIVTAISALYQGDSDQKTLSLCLNRLLQAAKQNWIGLAAFSPREQEILELLLCNFTYKEMSSRLHISPSTIKTHIYHIFQKLEVSSRDEAVRLIHNRGWFHAVRPDPLLVDVSSR